MAFVHLVLLARLQRPLVAKMRRAVHDREVGHFERPRAPLPAVGRQPLAPEKLSAVARDMRMQYAAFARLDLRDLPASTLRRIHYLYDACVAGARIREV